MIAHLISCSLFLWMGCTPFWAIVFGRMFGSAIVGVLVFLGLTSVVAIVGWDPTLPSTTTTPEPPPPTE